MPADTPYELLRELALHLRHDADVNGSSYTDQPYGGLLLSNEPGSLWGRIIVLTGEPDMIRDVVAPAIRERINKESGT